MRNRKKNNFLKRKVLRKMLDNLILVCYLYKKINFNKLNH